MTLKDAPCEVLTPPLRVILWRVYQSLHRLHQNGMKLSELVGLVPVVIAVGSKKIENLVKGSKWGEHGEATQPNWTLPSSSITNARSLKISP